MVTRVLFICHGSICRSPMAEFIMKKMVSDRGLADRFHIESAATSSEEIWNGVGNPVYPPAARKLAEHGISCSGHHARRLERSDYDRFDLLIGMESYNIRNMMRILGKDPAKKVCKLLDFAGGGDISDPWYTDDFDTAYRQIEQGCAALLEHFSAEKNIYS